MCFVYVWDWIDSISPRMDGNFTETLGQYLRREREARSVSLEELSRGTRISRPYLEALERDDLHFFSKREYTLGFLRGYARHLGLDPDEVIKRYRTQAELFSRKEAFEQIPLFSTPESFPEEIPTSDKVPASGPAKGPKASRRAVFIQLAVVLAAIGFTLYFQYLLRQPENKEKSPEGGRDSSRKEVAVKAPGPTQSVAKKDQEQQGEHPKETSSGKSTSSGKKGEARENGEAGPLPQVSP